MVSVGNNENFIQFMFNCERSDFFSKCWPKHSLTEHSQFLSKHSQTLNRIDCILFFQQSPKFHVHSFTFPKLNFCSYGLPLVLVAGRRNTYPSLYDLNQFTRNHFFFCKMTIDSSNLYFMGSSVLQRFYPSGELYMVSKTGNSKRF